MSIGYGLDAVFFAEMLDAGSLIVTVVVIALATVAVLVPVVSS